MRSWSSVLALAFIALLVTACSNPPKPEELSQSAAEVIDSSAASEAATVEIPDATTQGLASEAGFQGDPLNDPNSPLASRVIYFAYDSNSVETQYFDVLAAHGEYLAAHPDVIARLEGHADERGSPEYNIALGERRAKAVEQSLSLQGASARQFDLVSYGEERPAVIGHDESAWSANRRVEIIY